MAFGEKVVGQARLPDEAPGTDVSIDLAEPAGELVARLVGHDAIAADDSAPVVSTAGELTIAIVADPANAKLVTGGRPPSSRGSPRSIKAFGFAPFRSCPIGPKIWRRSQGS